MKFYSIFIPLLLHFRLENVQAAKILGILHIPGISHYRNGAALMRILAEKGHQVTVISPFREEKPPKNYTDITLDGLYNVDKQDSFFQTVNKPEPWWQRYIQPFLMPVIVNPMIEPTLNHSKFRELMRSDVKFDVVIVEEFYSLPLRYVAKHFNASLVLYSALEMHDAVTQYLGNPDNPASNPHFLMDFINPMNFFERLQNSVYYVLLRIATHCLMIPSQNRLLHEYFPEAPHMNDFIYDVSLALVNADPSVHDPAPKVPNWIDVAGFHIQKPKPLPRDLQDLLDNADEGVIYFSLGTNYKSKFIPKERREMLLKVFSRLRQTVLWKFEDDLPNTPRNVIVRKWLPQNEILGHKNVKLFITHGGIFSLIEAVYNAVPVLAFPLFGDQKSNVLRAEKVGYAKWLKFNDITEAELEACLKELLSNPKYAENARDRSKVLRDKPVSQADAVAFWVDYVVRHKGANHLRVAALNLNWYQIILLDVTAFVVIIVVLLCITVKSLLKFLLRLIRRNNYKLKVN